MKIKIKVVCPGCNGMDKGHKTRTDCCTYCHGDGDIVEILEVIEYEVLDEN